MNDLCGGPRRVVVAWPIVSGARESAEIDATPEAERQEIRDIYAAKGFTRGPAGAGRGTITASRRSGTPALIAAIVLSAEVLPGEQPDHPPLDVLPADLLPPGMAGVRRRTSEPP
jgi:hypothetical protein